LDVDVTWRKRRERRKGACRHGRDVVMVSAIAKAGLRSTERRGFRLRSTGRATRASAANRRKFGRRRFRPVRKTVPVFSSHFCDFLDWRTMRGFARSRMLVLRHPRSADRGGSGLSLEMPGPRGARSPRSVEAGEPTGVRADGTGAWTASREADAVPSAGGTISNEHLWRRGRRGTHLHDGSDDDTLADEGGGGECGDHF